jgi:hypothetical protein
MRMILEKFGNWNKVLEGINRLGPFFDSIRPIITQRIAERYVELVKEELVKRGPLIEKTDSSDTVLNPNQINTINEAELLSFIQVTVNDDGSVFAGIDHEIYIGKFEVLDFFFRKEFGLLGPIGSGVWRRCYRKMHQEIPDIVKAELKKFHM